MSHYNIVIETSPASVGGYRADVARGPKWARGLCCVRSTRGDAYDAIRKHLPTFARGLGHTFEFIPFPLRRNTMDEMGRQLTKRQLRQLEAQDWRCAYPCADGERAAPIVPGQALALAYDGNGIVHLKCAYIGTAPQREDG